MTAPALEACDLSLVAARNMTRLRTARGWSLADLTRATGLSPAMISLLEGGRRNFTMPVLALLAVALEVAPGDLLAPGTGGAG